ncbi:glycerate kinase [Gleimia europaea]|uniref:Glycerate kinase n=1 Tax=Gleimia europaea ACS-120-V-Col10b TaxID=883069 RepID=A0A9W5RDF3_9ACTO|nr:glycerate kinase [Gleimia europaea]EPD30372.1 hypothetical protein HMPREF9238_00110 [Gleimia europaea ACS-120-V-Col10b]
MTYTFNRVAVAGERATLESKDVASIIATIFQGAIAVEEVDLEPAHAATNLDSRGMHVCARQQLGNIEAWAPEGKTTWVVAGHDEPAANPVTTLPQSLTNNPEIGAIGTLMQLAGIPAECAFASVAEVNTAIGTENLGGANTAWFENRDLLAQVRGRALDKIGNRSLAVASATERPLLGLDSTLAQGYGGNALNVVGQHAVRALTQFYQQFSDIAQAEQLAPASTSFARAVGSGAGLGIGALALGLRGQLTGLPEVLADAFNLRQHVAAADLVVGIIDTLHPQTIADSPIRMLTALAAEYALPCILFTHESSLSKHELSEWGIHQAYVIDRSKANSDVSRILAGTWIRKR